MLAFLMPLAFLGNMRPIELIVILVVVLLLFGHKLPGLARSLGRSVNEFKVGIKEGAAEPVAPAAPVAPPAPAAPAPAPAPVQQSAIPATAEKK